MSRVGGGGICSGTLVLLCLLYASWCSDFKSLLSCGGGSGDSFPFGESPPSGDESGCFV